MTSMTAAIPSNAAPARHRHRQVRRMVRALAPFDLVTGIACLAGARPVAGWFGASASIVEATGGFFLLAAATGLATVARERIGYGWIAAANAAFGVWCLAAIGVGSPNALGTVLFAGGAVSALGTAAAEHRLSR